MSVNPFLNNLNFALISFQLFTDNFIQQENVCIATEVASSPHAIEELQCLCRKLLKENISFAARNIANGELAAIAVNHLMVFCLSYMYI